MPHTKITALIDTYNTEKFISEAISSILNQTRQPDEILIVDDGSTDNSVALIKQAIAEIPNARLIEKENGGQLSCISRGILESTGDIIALLDGDDLWNPNHLEEAEKKFHEHPCISLYFCDYETLGQPRKGVKRYPESLLNSTYAVTALSEAFFGNVTSTLVLNSKYIKPYLPIPAYLEQDWIINADNPIVWLTSFTGKQKYASSAKNVTYRMHANNMHKTSNRTCARAGKRIATKKLFEYFRSHFYIPGCIHKCLIREYKAQFNRSKSLQKDYLKAAQRSTPYSSVMERAVIYLQLKLIKLATTTTSSTLSAGSSVGTPQTPLQQRRDKGSVSAENASNSAI